MTVLESTFSGNGSSCMRWPFTFTLNIEALLQQCERSSCCGFKLQSNPFSSFWVGDELQERMHHHSSDIWFGFSLLNVWESWGWSNLLPLPTRSFSNNWIIPRMKKASWRNRKQLHWLMASLMGWWERQMNERFSRDPLSFWWSCELRVSTNSSSAENGG